MAASCCSSVPPATQSSTLQVARTLHQAQGAYLALALEKGWSVLQDSCAIQAYVLREYRPPPCSQMAGRRVPEKLVSWRRPTVAEESSQQRRQGGAAVAAARQPAATEVRRVVIWCSAQASYTSPSYQL